MSSVSEPENSVGQWRSSVERQQHVLMYLIERGHSSEVIEAYIQTHPRVKEQSRLSVMPLAVVMTSNRWELLPLLIRQGFDVDSPCSRAQGNGHVMTALDVACMSPAPSEELFMLVATEHNANAIDQETQVSVLDQVLVEGLPLKVKTKENYINHIDGKQYRCRRYWRNRAYKIFYVDPSCDVIRRLATPQQINRPNPDSGDTALHLAIKQEYHHLVPLLVSLGADVEARNLDDEQALDIAFECKAPPETLFHLTTTNNYKIILCALSDKSQGFFKPDLLPAVIERGQREPQSLFTKCALTVAKVIEDTGLSLFHMKNLGKMFGLPPILSDAIMRVRIYMLQNALS